MREEHEGKARFAVVGFDSCHAIEFTARLIGQFSDPKQNLGVGEVVAAFAGGSGIGERDQLAPRTEQFKSWGATVVGKLENLLDFELDGVLITSIDGRVHLEQAAPFIKARIPAEQSRRPPEQGGLGGGNPGSV